MSRIAKAAVGYVRHDFVIVALAQASKVPARPKWNRRENCIETVEEARQLDGNIGLAHAYSRTAALDIDDVKRARPYLSMHGVELDAISNAPDAVRIKSGRKNRLKLLYRLPKGVPPLATKQLNDHGFELRCATSSGLTTQDVLPPSIHPETGEQYEWEYANPEVGSWRELPELPSSVHDLWRKLLDQASTEEIAQERDPPCLDELRACVFRIDPDIEYPDWIRVGMALHHETRGAQAGLDLWEEWSSGGEKYDEEDDLAARWRGFSSAKSSTVGIGTLHRLGRLGPEDFEDLSSEGEAPARRLQVKSATEFMLRAVADWWVKGVLPKAALGLVYGATASGKTFWVLDLIAAISRGEPWRGMATKKGRVVYVAAEAAGGLAKRVRAYRGHFQVKDADLPAFIDAAPVLVEDVELLAREIERHGGTDIIVVDTLAQTIFGADENSSKDMSAVIGACRQLHDLTGAMVLLVHHTGKDQAKGARGHSSLRAAADVEIEISRGEGSQRAARITKMKDGEDFTSFSFRLLPVPIGFGADDELITSCVVEHQDIAFEAPRPKPKGSWQIAAYDVVVELADVAGARATKAAIVDQVAKSHTPPGSSAKGRRDIRYKAGRALDTLVERGVLVTQSGVYMPPQAPQPATDDD